MTTIKPAVRVQRKAAATRQAIIETAKTLIIEGGLEALTLEAVAERANIAVQTIYNRVGGRPGLLIAVAEMALKEHNGYMQEALEIAAPAREKMRLIANSYTRFAFERPNEFRLLLDPAGDAESLEHIRELIREQNARTAAVIRAGIAEGSIRADLDPDQVALAAWGMMNGILSLNFRDDHTHYNKQQVPALIGTAISLLVDGMFTGSP
ncbi:TetR/AcrR family transcriptional regulator [Pseudomonas sp. N040]|uniref:TetR/AcrR family transcriptional regulator n=1 Tax=Pseudomonas sp. N040 TaxID=2785325 RepID=UPI0018A2818D|nr:TetR/AcrR family transcriptional regulator [Pseudomonas sp. N040]MBF7729833.1 TetR/AcrR family transcriptional regulator [Pseudomonas sp. N040]MBW7013475.1 TetR/AcrR family transcriptional regulator [Pseudomonas sp. N040]